MDKGQKPKNCELIIFVQGSYVKMTCIRQFTTPYDKVFCIFEVHAHSQV